MLVLDILFTCILRSWSCFGACYRSSFPENLAVAPRFRATGLPCIASLEIKSSGNTQQHDTENNRFIDARGNIGSMLHQVARPSGTHGAAEQYVHYLVNIKGASITTSTRQRNNVVAETP